MWDLPRPGLEPMSPELAGRFSTTAPPGKPLELTIFIKFLQIASHSGYVQIDWKRVEKDVNKAKRQIKKRANKAAPEINNIIEEVRQCTFLALFF